MRESNIPSLLVKRTNQHPGIQLHQLNGYKHNFNFLTDQVRIVVWMIGAWTLTLKHASLLPQIRFPSKGKTKPALPLALKLDMGSISNHSYFRNSTDSSEDQSFSLFDIHILVPVTIISIILFFLGVSGNLITIVIFRRSQEMRTTVNMYLSSMALSDTLIFLGLPSDLYRLWKYKPYIFGDFLCKFFIYLSETCTYCTILHITTVSVERYFAICFPLKAKATITKCRVKRVILVLWGCSLLTAGPILFLFGVEHHNGSLSQESRECRPIERVARTGLLETMTWVSTIYFFLPMLCLTLLYGLICRKLLSQESRECRPIERVARTGLLETMTWVSTIYFFLPMLCLTLLYGLICRKLRRSGQRLPGCQAASRRRSHRQTVKMLAVVVFAFVLCWLPFHIGRLLFAQTEIILYDLTQYFNLIAMLLFYLGASINPILYNILSHKYREAMSKILHHKRTRNCRSLTRGKKVSFEGTELGSFTSTVQH
ncbi:PREDICTED: growth hormone secretagogue receptor type 1-like [Phaethon lepturus]|uniref:growth hormone secretagogue receptor type 1-like n=1 Tax=Phaethon lepturus TaxID=97097 RepID=UPI000530B087|nr:PREDICTED: growth hormone secretagogue receptor type 1-like [Phaethon lepturus]